MPWKLWLRHTQPLMPKRHAAVRNAEGRDCTEVSHRRSPSSCNHKVNSRITLFTFQRNRIGCVHVRPRRYSLHNSWKTQRNADSHAEMTVSEWSGCFFFPQPGQNHLFSACRWVNVKLCGKNNQFTELQEFIVFRSDLFERNLK